MLDVIRGDYHGRGSPLLGLILRTSVLTLLTLGIYRFWAKTRIRKYIWSATSGDGDSFEYTGTGLEKFLGFLVAVVILAIYLGLLQLLLSFFGIFLFSEPETATEAVAQATGAYVSLLAVVPLIFFAQYRARRYRMARTRWRGLRFGMDSAALGYVWRAIVHILLTILTLGILLPRQTFYLEKYMADRTWYGDGRFEQTGRWQALYPGLKHVVIGLAVVVFGTILGVSLASVALTVLSVIVGYVWFLVGLVYYRVFVVNYMASHKQFDGAVRFEAQARLGQVLKILIAGGLVLAFTAFIGFGLLGGLAYLLTPVEQILAGSLDPNVADAGMAVTTVIAVTVPYLFFLMFLQGVSLVMITQKILDHVVTSITIHNAGHLDEVRQRAADTGADAEGFADALDIGSAF